MRARRQERGFTLVEMMVSIAILSTVIIGLITFIAFMVRQNRLGFDRSEVQRGGRQALSILGAELENAGLGLPRRLVIKSFDATGSCNGTGPVLEIAALDYARQWSLQSATAGQLTLASATPTGAADAAIAAGEWVFVYSNSGWDDAGNAHGYGMGLVSANRAPGATTITIGSVAYSDVQTDFDIAALATGSVLRARTSEFSVDCTGTPYLAWSRNGQAAIPVVRGLDMAPLTGDDLAVDAASGDVVGLRFRFLLDADGDGRPDDTDNDDTISDGDYVTDLTATDIPNVAGIELHMRLVSDKPDSNSGRYVRQDFRGTYGLPNVNTRSQQFVFITNEAL